jgi:segregation and condensation protein A
MATGYFLKLDQFEGPLDLLLHLIKVNEIDIFNIDVFLLTNQYLEFLRLIKFEDLQQAGDFLEMAASLIEIKSRMLLPHDDRRARSEDGDDDPVRTLQERLVEYERFRAIAEHLSQVPQLGVEIQRNHEWARLAPEYANIEAPLTGDPSTLVVLYEQLLRTLPDRKAVRLEAKTHLISVEEKIEELTQLMDRINFALFQGFYKKFESRYEWVVYIMAMLEMARWKKLKVYQREALGPIWIYKIDLNESDLPLTREEKDRLLKNAADLAIETESEGVL